MRLFHLKPGLSAPLALRQAICRDRPGLPSPPPAPGPNSMVGPRNVGCQEAGFLPALLKPSVLQIPYSSFKYAISLKNTFYHTEDSLL